MAKLKVRLPNKPSKLIRLALKDLEKVERQPDKYTINMSRWHIPPNEFRDPQQDDFRNAEERRTCSVCLAGSVMAGTLKKRRTVEFTPNSFPRDVEGKLNALNEFRTGDIIQGLSEMDIQEEELDQKLASKLLKRERTFPPFKFPDYDDSPKKFKLAMNRLANFFEKVGL